MNNSEQTPLLPSTVHDDNADVQDGITSKRKGMMTTLISAIVMVGFVMFSTMKSASTRNVPAQQVAKDNQATTESAFQYLQNAAEAKFIQEEHMRRSSVDSFIESFAEETTQSFYTHLYKGSREKLRSLSYLNTTEAYGDLVSDRKSSAVDFYKYVSGGWEAQINQGYCPVAAAAAVLNSLRNKIELPQDPMYAPFPWATQFQVIHDTCVKQNVLDVEDPKVVWVGLPLEMAAGILDCHLSHQGYMVETHHIDPAKIDKYTTKKLIRDAVLDPKARVMINYDRGGIGQGAMGHGHFSPIGAYNYKKDAFLIMDVAKYKFPPVWVPSFNLYNGVGSPDNCGDFEYPQDPRITAELKGMNPPNFTRLLEVLNCKPKYRGVVVVRPKK